MLQALAEHFSLPASKVGFLTAAYPAGMFGALFVWPKLSDAIGRKTVLCLTLVGVGLGFVFQVPTSNAVRCCIFVEPKSMRI